MKKHVLMSTAAAMALAAGAGAAQAADVMPIVVPVVVVPPVVVPGPIYRVEIEAGVVTGRDFGDTDPLAYNAGAVSAVDVRTASGFGFKLETTGNLYFEGSPPPLPADASILGRIYHTIGDHGTVGVFATTSWNNYGPPGGHLFGIDADFDNDTLWVNYSLGVGFTPGSGYDGIQSILASRLERDRLVVRNLTLAALPAAGTVALVTLSEVGYKFGPVTPYVQFALGAVGGGFSASAGVGADLELPVGDGPLTITGGVFAQFGPGGFDWEATAGMELNFNDGPLTLKSEFAIDATGWGVRLGIGVEFGPGRISGFGQRTLEDFLL